MGLPCVTCGTTYFSLGNTYCREVIFNNSVSYVCLLHPAVLSTLKRVAVLFWLYWLGLWMALVSHIRPLLAGRKQHASQHPLLLSQACSPGTGICTSVCVFCAPLLTIWLLSIFWPSVPQSEANTYPGKAVQGRAYWSARTDQRLRIFARWSVMETEFGGMESSMCLSLAPPHFPLLRCPGLLRGSSSSNGDWGPWTCRGTFQTLALY
jgi:hypothetical protein